jgi:hypothetical protein
MLIGVLVVEVHFFTIWPESVLRTYPSCDSKMKRLDLNILSNLPVRRLTTESGVGPTQSKGDDYSGGAE